MTVDFVVELGRKVMETTLWLVAPILIVAMVVSLVINVAQVLTSVQEPTISTVPRLMVTGLAVFLLMPWMLNRLCAFMLATFSDLRPFVR